MAHQKTPYARTASHVRGKRTLVRGSGIRETFSATQRGGKKKAHHRFMGARAVRLVARVLRAKANGVPRLMEETC